MKSQWLVFGLIGVLEASMVAQDLVCACKTCKPKEAPTHMDLESSTTWTQFGEGHHIIRHTITTNWVHVGTYTPDKDEGPFDVLSGRVETNLSVEFTHGGKRYSLPFLTNVGPTVGERRERHQLWITNGTWTVTNFWSPRLYMNTNWTNCFIVPNVLSNIKAGAPVGVFDGGEGSVLTNWPPR